MLKRFLWRRLRLLGGKPLNFLHGLRIFLQGFLHTDMSHPRRHFVNFVLGQVIYCKDVFIEMTNKLNLQYMTVH